jgi:YD repeat-containing protein
VKSGDSSTIPKLTETTAQGTVYSAWDIAGRRTQLTWPDGFNVQYDYDMAGELVDVREYGQTGHAEDFAYNDLGQRTSRISYGASSTVTWGYNSALWLDHISIDLPGTAYDRTWTYGENRAGQITTRTSANPAYDWPVQLTRQPAPQAPFVDPDCGRAATSPRGEDPRPLFVPDQGASRAVRPYPRPSRVRATDRPVRG